MKKFTFMIIPALFCGVMFISCNTKITTDDDTKDEDLFEKFIGDLELVEATYSGTFTYKYPVSSDNGKTTVMLKSGKTTVVFDNGKFNGTGNLNRVPAGGSGNFTISYGKIIFEEIHVWTCDFDQNLILYGEYDYKFDGERLMFARVYNGKANYIYDLKKK